MQEERNDHSHIYEQVVKASYELRRILGIDDSSSQVVVSNIIDSRKYYLHNVLSEVDKSTFSVMFANDFLLANQPALLIPESDKALNSKIMQTKIDELSLWRRKLIEILIDLIGFSKANNHNYYKHYNLLHELDKKQKQAKDHEEFWGCTNQLLKQKIQILEQEVDLLATKIEVKKCWYAERKSNVLKCKLSNERNRFIEILQQAKKYQKAILLSYRNSFGLLSEKLHPRRLIDENTKVISDFEHAIRGVSVLSLYVISAIKDLLRLHNVKGVLKQIADCIKENPLPIHLLNLRTNAKIVIGDFVITQEGPAEVIKTKKNKTKKYGYKTLCVKHLIIPSSKIEIEEYIPEEIQMLAPKKEIKNKLLQLLGASSQKKINSRQVNQSIKDQVLQLWALIQGNPS